MVYDYRYISVVKSFITDDVNHSVWCGTTLNIIISSNSIRGFDMR